VARDHALAQPGPESVADGQAERQVAGVEQQPGEDGGQRVAGRQQADREELRAAGEDDRGHQERHPHRQPVRDRDGPERRADRDHGGGDRHRVAQQGLIRPTCSL
jgi:hypothetical protein